MAFKPRAWRNARQSNSYMDAEMAAAGRAPNGRGGYKSRPGAPLAANDTLRPTGTPGVMGGFTDKNTWNNFFHPPTQKMPDVTPATSATSQQLSEFYDEPVEANPNDPSSYAKAAQQGAMNYFDSTGQPINKPGPGVIRPLPYIPVDPASNALDNPDFVGNPYGDVGSDDEGLFTEF